MAVLKPYLQIMIVNVTLLCAYLFEQRITLAVCYSVVGVWLVWQSINRRRWAEFGAGVNFLIIAYRVQLSELVGPEFWTQFHIWAIVMTAMLVVIDLVTDQHRGNLLG